jgi:hypothetical protein
MLSVKFVDAARTEVGGQHVMHTSPTTTRLQLACC